MSTGSHEDDTELVKLNVKVPRSLLEELEEMATELNYTNRSEFIRAILRDTTEPILSPGAQEGTSRGYTDVSAGRTMSISEAREHLGLEDNTDE